MRSRYTAHVRRDDDYLRATWHPAKRPADGESEHVEWRGLEVVSVSGGAERDHQGTVAFVAHYVDDAGRAQSLRETSRFIRHEGRWVYVDGDVS